MKVHSVMKYLNATDVHILKRRSEFYILIYFKTNNKIKVSLEESLTMASGEHCFM